MKTLIIGAGPLGSLYAFLFHRAGIDVTLLARGQHYDYLEKSGLTLINEFTGEEQRANVKVVDDIYTRGYYDLAIVIMRKNSTQELLPFLSQHKQQFHHILFMGNNAAGFYEYLEYLPPEKILFGFPGGGGSRLGHVVHYVDTAKPGGSRMPVVLGEIDGKIYGRTRSIQELFELAGVPVKIVDDINSWLKYHVAFILPVAGALLRSGDNYRLAKDRETLNEYVHAVRESGRVLKSLGYRKSYNPKLRLFYWFPIHLLVGILRRVFGSKFAEVAMMMHVNAAKDEMMELAREFKSLQIESGVETPFLDKVTHLLFEEEPDQPKPVERAPEMSRKMA